MNLHLCVKREDMRQLKITQSITSRESKALEKYLADVSKLGLITAEEEFTLAQQIREGSDEALEKMVSANLRFVVSVAKQYQGQGLSLSDLINEGNLGLIKAAKRFDETRGFKFISYAVWWIRQSIMQAIAEQSRMVRLPLNQVNSLRKINQTFAKLEQEHNRPPTEEEVAEVLDLPLEKVTKTNRAAMKPRALDAPVKDDSTTKVVDLLQNDSAVLPDSFANHEDLSLLLNDIIQPLSEVERTVICGLFGINEQKKTKHELAYELDLSAERIRQVRERAIKKLRKPKNLKILRSYI